MCGIAGIAAGGPRPQEELRRHAARMASTLRHRGPDDEGVWADPEAGVGLGFRRLAILDLSPQGHQPMHSADGRYTIVFNGEIYNFAELRKELEGRGHNFRSRGDTEVVLAGAMEWGPLEMLRRLAGMFAFALWDRGARELWLARDRVGIKPLYYGAAAGAFLFASELRALRAYPRFTAEVDEAAAPLLAEYGYIPAPLSIIRGVRKLTPGSYLRVPAASPLGDNAPQRFFALSERLRPATDDMQAGDVIEQCSAVLQQAVRRHMISDVPVGALLSGGVDSTCVVAEMCAASSRTVKTFTIGFDVGRFDEAPYARRVAAHLGTDHTELIVDGRAAMAVIPELAEVYDEPFADDSALPTLLLSRLARGSVTVALSGDGGDELFGGYRHHEIAARRWRRRQSLGRLAPPLAPIAAAGTALARTLGWPRRLAESGLRAELMLRAREFAPFYDLSRRCGMARNLIGRESSAGSRPGAWAPEPDRRLPILEQMQYSDAVSYLPDDILTKVDRASMSVSLEARVPLLDNAMIEFAAALPSRWKQEGGATKWPLRAVLARRVPRELTDRPKTGFALPLSNWLRGPLREWARDLLSPACVARVGLLNPALTQRAWHLLDTGWESGRYQVWAALMLQAWALAQSPAEIGSEAASA